MPTSYRVQFESILEQNGIADSPVKILLGGMEKMRSVSGIALNNETILGVVPLEEPRLMGVPQPATRSTLPIIETNHLYSFDEIGHTGNDCPIHKWGDRWGRGNL